MVVQAKSNSTSENVEQEEIQESSDSTSESATNVLNLMKKRHKSSLKNGYDSLEILRINIQSYFNKQVDVIMKDFIDKFFQPAIENVKENTDEKIEEQQIKKICRNLLEDCARTQYSNDTTPSILKSSIKTDSDTNDETDSKTSLLHQALKRKRTESEAENLYKRQFFITTATNNFINTPVPSTVTPPQKPTSSSLLTSALTSPPKAMRHPTNSTRPIFHLIPANRNLKSTHVELLNLLKQNSSLPAIKTESVKTIVTSSTTTLTSDSMIQAPILERKMEDLNIERLEEKETVIVQNPSDELMESMQDNAGHERTLRRKRSSSEDAMHSINNKVIKKRKHSSSTIEFKTEKDVKKFYLNINKNVKVKPTLLETIFEKDESLEEETFTKDLGRATKRTLNVCDGFNINKSLIKKRKNLIKKNWGSRKKPRKVALKKFKEEFQKKMELFSMSSD